MHCVCLLGPQYLLAGLRQHFPDGVGVIFVTTIPVRRSYADALCQLHSLIISYLATICLATMKSQTSETVHQAHTRTFGVSCTMCGCV